MESNQDVISNQARTSLELVRFAVEVENKAHRSQLGVQRGAKAAFIFNPAKVWGGALARLLGTTADGLELTQEDIADALKLAALKVASGDSEFVITSLVGQAAVLQRLSEETAADIGLTDRLDFKSTRIRNYLALVRMHHKVLSAIAAMQARAARP